MNNYIRKEIIWAQGSKKSALPKFTTWSSTKDASFLGGFTISTYSHNEFAGFTAHTSHGESNSKFFQIPIDKIDEFCNAMQEVKDFVLDAQNS